MRRRRKSDGHSASVLHETSADALRIASDRLRGTGMTPNQAAAEMVHDNIMNWASVESDDDDASGIPRPRLRIVPRP